MILTKVELLKIVVESFNKMREEMSAEDYRSAINNFNLSMGGPGVEFVGKKKKGKRCLKNQNKSVRNDIR